MARKTLSITDMGRIAGRIAEEAVAEVAPAAEEVPCEDARNLVLGNPGTARRMRPRTRHHVARAVGLSHHSGWHQCRQKRCRSCLIKSTRGKEGACAANDNVDKHASAKGIWDRKQQPNRPIKWIEKSDLAISQQRRAHKYIRIPQGNTTGADGLGRHLPIWIKIEEWIAPGKQ